MSPLRLKKITKRWAAKHGACNHEVARFFRLFPNGLDLSDAEQVKRAWRVTHALSIAWLLGRAGVLLCHADYHDHGGPVSPCTYGAFAIAPCGRYYTKREMRSHAIKAGLPL